MIPNSEIWLCKNTKLRPDGEDTYNFANETARFNFFVSKSGTGLYFNALSYQRDDKSVRLPISFENAANVDYMVFTNTAYSSKHWYAFVTKVKYINDGTTELEFQIDPIQTWLPSLTLGSCLVSRETPASDPVFGNIQDEPDLGGELFTYKTTGLGGSYDANHKWADASTVQAGYIVLAVKRVIVEFPSAHATDWYSNHLPIGKTTSYTAWDGNSHNIGTVSVPLDRCRGVGCSYAYYCFPLDSDGFQACAALLGDYTLVTDASPDDVIAGFLCPACAMPPAMVNAFAGGSVSTSDCFLVCGESLYTALDGQISTGSSSYNSLRLYQLPATLTTGSSTLTRQKTTGNNIFGGYVPKNNKLYNAPYHEIVVDNGTGEQEIFMPERFAQDSNTVTFYPQLDSTVQVTAAFAGYNGDDKLFHMLQLDSYPTFNWHSNSFQEWDALFGSYQAQKTALGVVSSALGGLGAVANGAMSGNVLGAVAGGASAGISIDSALLDYQQGIKQARHQAPKSHGSTRGNMVRSMSGVDYIQVMHRSLRAQDAEKVDNYFTKYGYAINKIKSIDVTARSRFYYVKTSDFNVSAANVPTRALQEIAARFNRGLRFWHGDYLGDYSVTNSI